MSRSPKYSAVRASEERKRRLAREREEREQRRRAQEAARAAAALTKARSEAKRELDSAARLTTLSGGTKQDQRPVLVAIEEVRNAVQTASTPAEVSTALRRLDEINGMTAQIARLAEQRRTATALVEELEARLAGLKRDATETAVPLENLERAGSAMEFIRARLDADVPDDVLQLGGKLTDRLREVESELDSAIERISARREMLGSIVDALPTLGFAVDPESLSETSEGRIGIHAHRRTGELLAVVVEDTRRGEFRVNYLRHTGTTGSFALDRSSCSSLSGIAEQLNDSMRDSGFEAGNVTWDGDTRPPAVQEKHRQHPRERS